MFADLDEAAARKAAGKTGEAFWGDLSEEKVAGALIGQTVQTLGAPAILVNNAGGGILRPFLDHTPETLRATIDRNLWTAIWCSWHVLPHMKAAGWGRVIHIVADSVRNGLFDPAGSNAATGGMHGLTTGLPRQFAKTGAPAHT